MTYLLIGVGGLLGANARYLASTWAANRFGTAFPIGTFLINATGSFLLGLVLTLVADRFGDNSTARLVLATGFLGAYTTFSTFTYETVALLRHGEIRSALVNALGSATLGIAGAAAGIFLATLLAERLQ